MDLWRSLVISESGISFPGFLKRLSSPSPSLKVGSFRRPRNLFSLSLWTSLVSWFLLVPYILETPSRVASGRRSVNLCWMGEGLEGPVKGWHKQQRKWTAHIPGRSQASHFYVRQKETNLTMILNHRRCWRREKSKLAEGPWKGFIKRNTFKQSRILS